MSDTRTPSQITLADITAAHERVHLELLKLEVRIAEGTRAYHVDGIPTPAGERAAMLAQQKRLVLELHLLRAQRGTYKAKAMELKAKSFVSLLVQHCIDAGHADLVEHARAESMQSLADAGLLDAYRLKA